SSVLSCQHIYIFSGVFLSVDIFFVILPLPLVAGWGGGLFGRRSVFRFIVSFKPCATWLFELRSWLCFLYFFFSGARVLGLVYFSSFSLYFPSSLPAVGGSL
ncbi:hypothetical protein B0H14DRAFT_2769836, partial [Mycena olivaceomarginata]